VISSAPVKKKGWIDIDQCKFMWQKMRGGVMFAVACITSPCCTPLLVPIFLALMTGTPLAAWLGQNLGWVYGGLTLMSAVSFVIGLRWLNTPAASKLIQRQSDTPVISTFVGDKAHAD